jgi:flagellar hook assembly protein FlgD
VPNDPEARALEVRLHIYSRFEGVVYFDELKVEKIGTTGVVDNDNIQKEFQLSNNYPNPFNPSTSISYSVPQSSNVSLVIYNILGKKVRTLLNDSHSAGNYQVIWDGKDDLGNQVSSGMYLYALISGDISIVKKMILLK